MEKQYELLAEQMEAVLEKSWPLLSNLSNTASVLYYGLEKINWAGFYLLQEDVLWLGPFCGRPACVRIEMGKGVCGTTAQKRETVVVKDVHAFPGHIACDSASQSEIVVPLLWEGKLLGVLDIDSPVKGRFDGKDREGLERIAGILLRKAGGDWKELI